MINSLDGAAEAPRGTNYGKEIKVMMMFESLFILGALLIGAAWLSRGGTLDGLAGRRGDTSIDVLERRLAEGAISVDEYHERRAVLIGRASPSEAERESR